MFNVISLFASNLVYTLAVIGGLMKKSYNIDDLTRTTPTDELSEMELIRLPAAECIFCNKALNDVGGRRLIAQRLLGVTLSNINHGGGNKDYPHKSIELFPKKSVFMRIWGSNDKWTESAIMSAKNQYLSGKRPWFCQVCGNETCHLCESPLNRPAGADILYDDGYSAHCALLPCSTGCNNADCHNFRSME